MTDAHQACEALDATVVPRLRDGVVFIPVGDEAVLYDEEEGLLHRLDPIASCVIQHLDGGTSIQSAATALELSFGADADAIERDVNRFASHLGELGILIITHDDGNHE